MLKKILTLSMAVILAAQPVTAMADIITNESVTVIEESEEADDKQNFAMNESSIDLGDAKNDEAETGKTEEEINATELSKEEQKEFKKKEKQIKNILIEELKLHHEDYDENKLGEIYFNCYDERTDYVVTTYDNEVVAYYVRITPNGEYYLSQVKASDAVIGRFANMMTPENQHASLTFWNKVTLINPDNGLSTFQSVDWPTGIFNGKGGSIITPDIPLDNLIYTYEKWDRNWTGGTRQKRLHDEYELFDDEGFGRIGNRYVIACTLTFGNVGDCVDFYMSNGMVFRTVIGDIKSQHDPGCTKWGHKNGKNVIEFIVNSKIWYNTGHANPGNPSCHPEWAGLSLVKAVNYGSIWGNEA